MKQQILKKLKEEGLSIEELMHVKGGKVEMPADVCTTGDDSCDYSLKPCTQQQVLIMIT